MKRNLLHSEDTYEIVTQLSLIDIPVFVLIFASATIFQVEFCKTLTVGLALVNILLGVFQIVMKTSYERSEQNEKHR
jgi:hypothetical protein